MSIFLYCHILLVCNSLPQYDDSMIKSAFIDKCLVQFLNSWTFHISILYCRRGNPLHLSHELYAKLENLWLNQSIAEEVANQYEIDHRNIGLEWHHF